MSRGLRFWQIVVGFCAGTVLTLTILILPDYLQHLKSEAAIQRTFEVVFAANRYWKDHMAAAPNLQTLVTEGYLEQLPVNPYSGKRMREIPYDIQVLPTATEIRLLAEQADLRGNLVYLVANCSNHPRAQQQDPGLRSVFYLYVLGPNTPISSVNGLPAIGAWESGYGHSRPSYSMSETEIFLTLAGRRITTTDWPKLPAAGSNL